MSDGLEGYYPYTALAVCICYAYFRGQNHYWENPYFYCESTPHPQEMLHNFSKIKNAGHSVKYPTHFKENSETCSRIGYALYII